MSLPLPDADSQPGVQTCLAESLPKYTFFQGQDVWGADISTEPLKGKHIPFRALVAGNARAIHL